MGPGSGSGMGSEGMGSGSGGEDPVDMGSGSGSGSEDPVTMGPGSGSGSGALCPEKVLMTDCEIDCKDASPDPSTGQLFSSSEEIVGGVPVFKTSWTIFADNPAPQITLNCQGAPTPMVTECIDGGWTVPQEIKDICGSIGSGDGG